MACDFSFCHKIIGFHKTREGKTLTEQLDSSYAVTIYSISNLILIFNLKDCVLQVMKKILILFRVFNAVVMVIIEISLFSVISAEISWEFLSFLLIYNMYNAIFAKEMYVSDKNGKSLVLKGMETSESSLN